MYNLKYINKKLGEILIDTGVLTSEQVEKALGEQKGSKKRLGEILIENNYITQQQLIDSLVVQLDIPYLDLDTVKIDPTTAHLVPESIAKGNFIIPVKTDGSNLVLAVADPLDYSIISDMSIYTGMNINPVIAEKDKILDKLREAYASEKVFEAARDLIKGSELVYKKEDENTLEADGINDQPVIRLVNMTIEQAIIMGASDIHIEPREESMVIRFRVDGHLTSYMETGGGIMPAVVSRIKFIGGMNIAERRIPQDGRITYRNPETEADLRISILPSIHGEKVVIRIMSTLGLDITKEELGFSPENLEKFNDMLSKPHGIILITGPTGSGKSTTLYTALREKKREDINIITVEDPVEAIIDGITQVAVNQKAGLTFASALRSIVRQDPDVVMIGEIRDEETASIATRVAITGHLVLSTLHTNDAPSSVIRLVDMGVAPYMVSASIIGVVSQRLIRRICTKCKVSYKPSVEELKMLGMDENSDIELHKGEGCEFCKNTGYKGRIAIHEVMPVTQKIRKGIHEDKSTDEVRQFALEEGMITLQESAKKIVLDGITTVAEMMEIFVGDA